MPETWKLWEGRVVDGRFLLRQYLGGSDHNSVFLTDQGQGPERAAIKLFFLNPNQPTAQLRRLDMAKKLAHPHLLRIFHTGNCQLDGTELLYAVMEYAEENLSQILPDRPLTSAECRDLLPPLLEALAYIHGQGLVHSHLKPTNIMASSDQLKLAVDGLRAAGETGIDVRPSIFVPPEIVNDGAWSPASDVWSLGVTLVEALTQRAPLSAGNGELAAPKTMPAPFLEIAEHCLDRDPQRRWTIPEIAAQFQPSSSPPEKQPDTVSPTASSRKNSWAAMVAVLLLLFVILVGRALVHRHSNIRPGAPADASPEAPSGTAPPMSPTTPSGNAPGALVKQPLPDVPARASNTIQGKVKVQVKVSVDASGNVVAARLVSAGPSKYFANLALRAAPAFKFTSPQKDGQNVASEWILKYEFERAGTNVQAAQVSP